MLMVFMLLFLVFSVPTFSYRYLPYGKSREILRVEVLRVFMHWPGNYSVLTLRKKGEKGGAEYIIFNTVKMENKKNEGRMFLWDFETHLVPSKNEKMEMIVDEFPSDGKTVITITITSIKEIGGGDWQSNYGKSHYGRRRTVVIK